MNQPGTLTAVYGREGDDWVVHLAEDERVHTFGRTFRQAHDSIREAAALWYQVDLQELTIVDSVPEPDLRLPPTAT